MVYPHKIPRIISSLLSGFLWRSSAPDPVIYLTFDDGPVPGPTDFVLEELAKYEAQATFFCVGDNIRKHSGIFQKVRLAGHQVANHSFNHLRGWSTPNENYVENIELCQEHLPIDEPRVFRPPYGAISLPQASLLRQKGYQIVMWDVLTGDFDPHLSPEVCLRNAIKYTQNGSIVVFHDSHKAFTNLSFVLPRFLEYFAARGVKFGILSDVLPSHSAGTYKPV